MSEQSYLDNLHIRGNKLGSSRADVIKGLPAAPDFAVELKAGYFSYVDNE